MKRNHLKKAILLGLIAASIHAPVWAAGLWPDANKTVETGDLFVESDGPGIGVKGTVNVKQGNLTVDASGNGIYAGPGLYTDTEPATVEILANNVTITSGDNGLYVSWGEGDPKNAVHYGNLNMGSEDRNITGLTINANGQGIDNKKGNVNIYGSDESDIYIHSTGTEGNNKDQAAIHTGERNYPAYGTPIGKTHIIGGDVELQADGGSGIMTSTANSETTITASGSITITSKDSGKTTTAGTEIENAGINNMAGTTEVTAANGITITSSKSGILAQNLKSNATSTTSDDSSESNDDSPASVYVISNKGNNIIQAAAKDAAAIDAMSIDATDQDDSEGTADPQETRKYGTKHAIKAEGGAQVKVSALNGDNELYGVIYAKNNGTAVTVDHNAVDSAGNQIQGRGSNYIYSAAHGSTDEVGNREKVVAALYAQDKGTINITAGEGGINYIETYYPELESAEETQDETEDPGSERTIWAQRGGKINIKGQTFIIASNANTYTEDAIEGEEQVKGNAIGIAITAGSEEIPENGINSIEDESRSHVTVEYNANGPLNSFISGDIVSGYGGLIDIRKTDDSGLDLMGNALAANGGKLNLDLGNGGTWLGRADDYGDAGVITDGKHTTFFDPAFSNEIIQGGQVNLTMGEGSRWNINGQSWITSIKTTTGDLTTGTPVIDLVNANTDRTTTAHALTVYELTGNAIFNMSLDGDREVSDMLYIKKADGEYVINVVDAVSVADMYQNDFKGLRFATIGDGSDVSFRAVTYDQGINNIEYLIDTDSYEENKENDAYNSTEDDGGMNTEKPGSARVDEFFESTGTPDDPLGTGTDTIMTFDAETEDTTGTDGQVQGTTNFKLVGIKNSELSDGGKTVVNMSRVNYSNAVYMDRLNKRLGEARYINEEEDQGMWVRVRHDRIGKDDAFRLMNTMYELGYDKKQESDSGERRFGAAIDYMDGSSSYTSVSGSGDISRKGIWLYDTWLGHKGHYRDFVAKWGHLSNDFTLYRGGDKITGDYCNNVYSLSAEYGRKKDLGHDWYFEPQAQLQYARVTGADYTTSQGTRVDLDAIDSLIARAGFRLGRDLDERSTVYFKADLLHEFLGDQNIYAADGTGTMNVTYDNEGTWFDVGLGFSKALSETSYVYLDVETSLGNDFEDTYQINAGLQWSFS